MQALIIGCGYLGRRIADRWIERGDRVAALTRSFVRASEWKDHGLDAVVGDVLAPETLKALPAADVLLYAVGFDRAAGVDKRSVYVNGLRNVLAATAARIPRVVYISSSSVYGQSQGEWIDEASPAEPQSEGGRICLEAEHVLTEAAAQSDTTACILRLTGIYGPDRILARAAALRQGTPLAGRADAWLNLIHVDDAASAAMAAADHPNPDPLYLVTDDRPVTRQEYFSRLAERIGAPLPSFDPSQQPRHGAGLNKRCHNARMKGSLGVSLQYPTFDEGLRACT
jgi:nucleoside-diphosphate-sugar epimerase